MIILHKMTLKSFFTVFFASLVFFVLIIELLDIFSNLWRFINNNVSIIDILKVAAYFFPKCIFYSLPIAILFSVSYTIATSYSNNELIAVFGSGISIYYYILPFIICGFLFSLGLFIFQDKIVIPSYRLKNELTAELLRTKQSYSNTNVTVTSENRNIIYSTDYYNDQNETLTSLLIINKTEDKIRPQRIDAKLAVWDENKNIWILYECRVFEYDSINDTYKQENLSIIENPLFNLSPSTFRKIIKNVEEMTVKEASEWIGTLKSAGLPYKSHLTEYYKKFSFPLTCLIVSIFSSAVGGSLKKNILLMSLLTSLLFSVFFYIIQMVLVLFAKLGYLPPLAGAWGSFIIFLIFGIVALKYTRT